MIEEVGCDATGVVPILAPAEIAVLAEGAFGSRPEEALPIDVVFGSFGVDLVIPFPMKRVAAISPLRPERLADGALRD